MKVIAPRDSSCFSLNTGPLAYPVSSGEVKPGAKKSSLLDLPQSIESQRPPATRLKPFLDLRMSHSNSSGSLSCFPKGIITVLTSQEGDGSSLSPTSLGKLSTTKGCQFSVEFSSTVAEYCELINSVFSNELVVGKRAKVIDTAILGEADIGEGVLIDRSQLESASLDVYSEVVDSQIGMPLKMESHSQIRDSFINPILPAEKVTLGSCSEMVDCVVTGNVEIGNASVIRQAEIAGQLQLGSQARMIESGGHKMIFHGLEVGDGVELSLMPKDLLNQVSRIVERSGEEVRLFDDNVNISFQDGVWYLSSEQKALHNSKLLNIATEFLQPPLPMADFNAAIFSSQRISLRSSYPSTVCSSRIDLVNSVTLGSEFANIKGYRCMVTA